MMLNTRFAPWPCFSKEEVAAVADVLRSNKVNYWTGDECRKFETEFAEWVGTTHAIALANGTVALDLALKAVNVGPGDEVIVTPRTFIASISTVVNAGATPVFADVDLESGNITAETIAAVISPRTKAVVPVHLAGWPCDMDAIMDLSAIHGFKVIEDCAQAHGAQYRGRNVGSIGHIGAWSFCQDKIMTTGGEGGMVTTNDPDLWSKMWSYKDHGKSYDAVYHQDHGPGFRWLHHSFGTNWRMIEMQAAIGRIQLRKMADWSAARKRNANMLISTLEPFASRDGFLRIPMVSECDSKHAFYKLYAYLSPDKIVGEWSRDMLVERLVELGAPCYQGSCSEAYLEKAFKNSGLAPVERLSNARQLGETSLMFLVHPSLTDEDMHKYVTAIEGAMHEVATTQEIFAR
jgi:dTDP-4-amino-4,6-dideoxygalactose transaminase